MAPSASSATNAIAPSATKWPRGSANSGPPSPAGAVGKSACHATSTAAPRMTAAVVRCSAGGTPSLRGAAGKRGADQPAQAEQAMERRHDRPAVALFDQHAWAFIATSSVARCRCRTRTNAASRLAMPRRQQRQRQHDTEPQGGAPCDIGAAAEARGQRARDRQRERSAPAAIASRARPSPPSDRPCQIFTVGDVRHPAAEPATVGEEQGRRREARPAQRRRRLARRLGGDRAHASGQLGQSGYSTRCNSSNMYGIISYTVGWMCIARRITV